MGGVEIDEITHALRADGSIVPGLYCAGEITGVIHGGNRLGGNAIVDFTVFGRIAGTNAAAGK
jgi:succinate dehydrogenase/fumarate reductase flavoprotein subunit